MKKPELLSPAGNMECLYAAVQGGCDAVYLGGHAFGARSFAGNFSDEAIIEAVKYAHLYGVKVYVTVNTLVYENEVDRFMTYIDFLYRNNVDAIIVQDLGMMDLVRKIYPNLEIHASTQMHIHNIEGVKAAQSLGLKRVVLARETDMDTICNIKQNTNIELEIFIHGALCFCYSGQCLMSSMIGGRSGNRGTCTQCCRMPYTLYNNGRKINMDPYVLSPKDLNSLDNIGKLIEIGVDSLKIEGRMKRPEYVYYVTKLYRKAIDQYCDTKHITITDIEINTLKKLFHRGFTKGFLFHESNSKWINPKRPNHIGIKVGEVICYKKGWVTCKLMCTLHQNDGIRILGKQEDKGCILNKIYQNKKLVNSGKTNEEISFFLKGAFQKGDALVLTSDFNELLAIQKEIASKPRKVPIDGKLTVKIGCCLQYQIYDGFHTVTVRGTIPVTEAKKLPVSKERIYEQFNKLGDTVYRLTNLDFEMDQNVFVPIQELNQIRRQAIEQLNEKRIYKRDCYRGKYTINVPEWIEDQGYTIHTKDGKIKGDFQYKQIYMEDKKMYEKWKEDSHYIYQLPRVITEFESIDSPLIARELGSIYYYHPIYSDFSLNVTNSYAVAFLHSLGIQRVTLSLELNLAQIQELIEAYQKRYHKKPNVEVLITEYPEVMITKFDLPSYYQTSNSLTMEDEKKHQFLIRKSDAYTKIYYHKKQDLLIPEQLFSIGVNTVSFDNIS